MKTVNLKTPFIKEFKITGSEKDKSIIGTIESSGGYYEKNIMELLQEIIKPTSICFDIGANIGVISLCLGYLASKGKVYAFEPSQHNFGFLMQNIAQNNCLNINAINCGIYDEECNPNFSYVEEVAGCSFISNTGIKEGIAEKIKCVTLDKWVENNRIDHIDFIKMDVEGSEIKALAGSEKTINNFNPDLIIEFNPIPMIRFFDVPSDHLYKKLVEMYSHIYLISGQNDKLIKIKDFSHLDCLIKNGKGWEDLLCSNDQKSFS